MPWFLHEKKRCMGEETSAPQAIGVQKLPHTRIPGRQWTGLLFRFAHCSMTATKLGYCTIVCGLARAALHSFLLAYLHQTGSSVKSPSIQQYYTWSENCLPLFEKIDIPVFLLCGLEGTRPHTQTHTAQESPA